LSRFSVQKPLLMKIGNTRIAWECGSASGHFLTKDWKPNFSRMIKRFSMAEWWIASVIQSEKNAMASKLRKVCHHWLKVKDIPGSFAYQKGLGIDRALNIHACRVTREYPSIVVDCGTAVTLEYVDVKGRHAGGWILPGLRLQLEALHKRTDALPLSKFEKPSSTWGRSTQSCINAGVFEAVEGAIESARQKASKHCGKRVKIILTGGWARAFLRPGTKYRRRLVFEALENLTKKVTHERSRSTLRRTRSRT